MSNSDFTVPLGRVLAGETLEADASARAFAAIMAGGVAEADVAAFLTAQSRRGPTVPEIVGAARAMRAAMTTVTAPGDAIDVCGTGGDGHGTLNVSTAVSFVAAGCGVPVAKHGNRSATSRAGAADVLEKLGVRIDSSPECAAACLREAGLCFLFAQTFHVATKNVAAVRRRLGFRTIFNLLGPLSNPAGVRRQLIGVYSRDLLEPLAEVLTALGTAKAWVVHGNDGLDELTTTDVTHVAILEGGKLTSRIVASEDAGLARACLADLKGGDAQQNASALARLLAGQTGPYRDIVLLNAAAALIVAGKARDLRDGAAMAAASIDTGEARRALERLVAASNRVTP